MEKMNSSLHHTPAMWQISSKSMSNFLSYVINYRAKLIQIYILDQLTTQSSSIYSCIMCKLHAKLCPKLYEHF